jgi:SAM-dependent methyltransferase
MLAALDIQSTDSVVEFAPGLGVTAQLTLSRNPASYIAIERDKAAANQVLRYLFGPNRRCAVGRAEDTGLPESSATVLYCEAMLTMQTPVEKMQIVREASRLLKPGGRCGIHELCLVPDDLDDTTVDEIRKALSMAIQVGARPLTSTNWRALMESAGFSVQVESVAPQHLLEPKRFLQDEGLRGSLVFAWNLLRSREAQRRVWNMRTVFRKYQKHFAAIMLVSVKKELR